MPREPTVWEQYADGDSTGQELEDGDTADPSDSVVYSLHLESDSSSNKMSIEISEGGAYAIFLEHGEEELTFELTSADGEVIEAVLTESAEEHAEDDDHDHDDEESTVATGTQWANAIGASLVISVCR